MTVKNKENKFAKMVGRQKLLQWENYVEGKSNDLNKINEKIFSLIKEIDENKFEGRKRDYFNKIKLKYLIENDPDVASLRNKLDDRANYNNDLDKSAEDYQYRLALSLREDVVNLIKIRNQKAKDYGFSGYPEMIFQSEELDKEKVEEEIKDYLYSRIDKTNKLIEKYNLNWNEWFTKLRSIGELNYYNEPYHYIKCLFHKLGLESLQDNIRFEIKDQPISGMAFPISIPDDIRILLKPTTSIMNCRTLFHECGHAINYASNKENGIFTIYTTFFDEFTAILFENIGLKSCFSENEREIANDIKLLETIRTSISFLFEMELWKNPDNADKLFEEYQNILSIQSKRKEMWTLDTFRYIDPVYVHNYVLGEIYAQKVIDELEREYELNFEKWGQKIQNVFLKTGIKESFREKYNNLIKR